MVQRLSTDGRPEVRNSGVRTLYSVVVSHGAHLSREQWQHCWWSMLFPLLRTVHHMSTTSSREEVSGSCCTGHTACTPSLPLKRSLLNRCAPGVCRPNKSPSQVQAS